MATNNANSQQNIAMHSYSRLVLDDVCDNINQVNSNGEGYSKEFTLPDKISGSPYKLKVSKDDVIFHGGGRTAKNQIMPINLVKNNLKVDSVELHGGNTYIIKKHENNGISIDGVWI
ncbi:MAG: hypothetical protein Q4P18_06875 [Methanobrevibacter sp.]|uniref:hypothetical protein n=1 Tax=Methanobrevibacter sp. TaxID=66852 RepID=UPI0026E054FD|nr:hypothetical protein [Methanobrevibacter sp.]MDO5849239.1 hypothetical protein [Methanobrevibacter sp.]